MEGSFFLFVLTVCLTNLSFEEAKVQKFWRALPRENTPSGRTFPPFKDTVTLNSGAAPRWAISEDYEAIRPAAADG
jgi:hypothetical protein